MTQHFLNHPYVRSVVKQMRGKRMSNKLRIYVDTDLESDSHGQAIVHTPTDAVRTFFSSGMDALVIGSFLVDK